MSNETKILGGILIASLVLILGAVFFLGKSSVSSTSLNTNQTVNIDYSEGQKIGSDSAKVKLAEFSDLQCPACKAAEPYVKQVREKYSSKIQFIYFHFPLMQHIHSRAAANFAEYAATQGKFWQVHDKLFETQDQWSSLSDPVDFFVKMGTGFGLKEDQVREAITKSSFEQKINDNLAQGNKLGVAATPTFYLNGQKLDLESFTDLDKKVSEALQRK